MEEALRQPTETIAQSPAVEPGACREMTPEESALRPMESPVPAAETPPPQPRIALPRFRSHKVVEAAKVVHVDESALILDPGDGRDQFVQPVSEEWVQRHKPRAGGYFVRYSDGYESWSPAEAFEAGYGRLVGASLRP